MANRGAVIVISGPSGSGKTTMVRRVLADDPALLYSVSATTRKARAGEADGRDYRFLSRAEFELQIAAGGFAEHAEVCGNLYGTPAAPLAEALKTGRVMVLDIDVQGARQIRKKFPGATFVFIRPPSFDVLAERLRGRKTESEAQYNARLSCAREELAAAGEYDVEIVNDRLEDAIGQLKDLIRRVKEKRDAEQG